jgi:hypothetical protein
MALTLVVTLTPGGGISATLTGAASRAETRSGQRMVNASGGIGVGVGVGDGIGVGDGVRVRVGARASVGVAVADGVGVADGAGVQAADSVK